MSKYLFFIIFILQATQITATSNLEAGKPLLTNYTSRDYQANPSNMAIVQDLRGVMYFGNADGVLEYDGVSWRLIPLPNHTIARSLAFCPTGRIYVGSVGEFGFLAPDSTGRLNYHSLLPHLAEAERDFFDVWDIHVTSHGVYFRTATAIFHWHDHQIKIIKPKTRFHTSYAVRDEIYTRQWDIGLMKISGDSLVLVPGGERFADERIYAMLPYKQDKIFLGTRKQGLFLYDGSTFRPFPSEVSQYLLKNQLYSGAMLKNNTFALGTNRGGVVIIDSNGQFLILINKTNGLPGEAINDIFLDRQDGVWLALDEGLSRVEYFSPISYFDDSYGIDGGVNSILRHQGRLFLATSLGVFYLSADNSNTQFGRLKFNPISGIATQCWDLLAFDDRLLVATGDGVYQIVGDRATFVKRSESREFYAWTLLRSKQNSNQIYVGLDNGLARLRYQNGEWIDEGRLPGIQDNVRAIVENDDGSLWLGKMRSGVIKVTNPTIRSDDAIWIQRFGSADGLPAGQVGVYDTPEHPVFASNEGLFYFNAQTGRFNPDTTFGTGRHKIGLVVADSSGDVWIGMDAPGEINVAHRQPESAYSLERTPFLRVPKGEFFAIYPENDGVVWFVTPDNLFRFDSNVSVDYERNYPTLIRQVILNDDSVIFNGTDTVPGDLSQPVLVLSENRIRFEFAATVFNGESGNDYQTFLAGFDEEWSKFTQETVKEYSFLPAGDYQFQVRAKNVYGHPGTPTVYRFKILPPWYRTWWAYGLYAVILMLGVLAVDRFQRSRLIRREREKARIALLEAENRRKTEELDKARQLQLSMLPGEIPQLPELEIAAYMKTATEVGGDYYDFHVAEDGTLTVVIGDATGHGLNAGMMVTATKSLFNALAHQSEIRPIFQQSNHSLKRMNLKGLFMALLMLKIKDHQATICSAGMPPLLLYRAGTGAVEEITTKDLPLGGISNLTYRTLDFQLDEGDTILLMSDGFPERFNGHSEIIGYEKARDVLRSVAGQSPRKIIRHFVRIGDTWANHRPLNDDITFVVLKVKNSVDPAN